jgi:hypothetical protein
MIEHDEVYGVLPIAAYRHSAWQAFIDFVEAAMISPLR